MGGDGRYPGLQLTVCDIDGGADSDLSYAEGDDGQCDRETPWDSNATVCDVDAKEWSDWWSHSSPSSPVAAESPASRQDWSDPGSPAELSGICLFHSFGDASRGLQAESMLRPPPWSKLADDATEVVSLESTAVGGSRKVSD